MCKAAICGADDRVGKEFGICLRVVDGAAGLFISVSLLILGSEVLDKERLT